jgi:hypothetical protein
MALFIVPNFEFFLQVAKEYFKFWRREELRKLQARFQPTTTIPTNVSVPKEILDLTTPHDDSHENENSLTFDGSPTHLCKTDHNSQNSPYLGRFLEMFNLH